jgi:HAD superfamily hydrolase (TIGR01509 family)
VTRSVGASQSDQKVFKAVIFDCDGVLVDSEKLALQVELEVLAELDLTFDREDYVLRFMGLSTDAYYAAIDEEARKRLGRSIQADARGSDRIRQVMIAHLTEVPGALAAVAALNLPKAVASSGSRAGLERKLRQTGLWDHFAPHVFSADHVANAKPAPDLFLRAAQSLGVPPQDCLALEDSVNGVIAARAAGMTVWGFLGGGHVHDGLGPRLMSAGAERLVRNWPEAARLFAA